MADTTILLAPFERGVTTKTKKFDEAISLQDSRAPWLGAAVERHAAARVAALRGRGIGREQAKEQRLWTFSRPQLLHAFRDSAERLNALWLAPTLYVLRHGGASRDAGLRLRSLPEIMRRGRWSQLSSVKTYEKHGRLQHTLHRMGPALVARGRAARRSFSTRFRHG